MTRLRTSDRFLIALWVFSYAILIRTFRILKRIESA